MPYEVTATRKRPQNFDHLAGQEFVVSTLKNSLTSGRMAHSYLFSGPRGVGKTSAARILARCLNCVDGPTADPCGVCENCKEIARGNALDVIEIDGASNTSVNDVREIKDEVLFAPNSARYKIYIIDEVHMLSNSAFNALLKTIEEPPPYIVFVFATTEVHKVPATIRSRCQQYTFRLISIDTIKDLLSEVAGEMEINAEDDALFWMAKEATGSLRDAYTLFDQVASFADGTVTLELIREKLGLVGMEQINEMVELLVAGQAKEALELADDVLRRGVSVEQFVMDMAEYFRNLLFLANGIRKEALLGYSPDRFSKAVLSAYSEGQIETALELALGLYRDLRYSLNQRFELELYLCRLSVLTDQIHPSDIVDRIRQLKNEIARGVTPSGGPVAGDPALREPATGELAAGEPVTAARSSAGDDAGEARQRARGKVDDSHGEGADEGAGQIPAETDFQPGSPANSQGADFGASQWQALLGELKRKHLSLASVLEKAVRWSYGDETLSIVSGTGYQADTVRRDTAIIAQAVGAIVGRKIKVEVRTETETAAEGGESEDDFDHRVELIRRVFRGEVVEPRR